jgi:hypothetical protein
LIDGLIVAVVEIVSEIKALFGGGYITGARWVPNLQVCGCSFRLFFASAWGVDCCANVMVEGGTENLSLDGERLFLPARIRVMKK